MASKRYIVFGRPEGSKCWTMAWKVSRSGHDKGEILPALFLHRASAETWVADVHSKRKGWKDGIPNQTPMTAHIAEVELPE